jgi:hypothetical protein
MIRFAAARKSYSSVAMCAWAFPVGILLSIVLSMACPSLGQTQPFGSATWTVSLVLPARVVAGKPAMLAVLGVDGRLASGVTVEVGNERVTTDETGRASFTAPPAGHALLANGSGASAAAVIDSAPPMGTQGSIAVAPVVALRQPFSICGFNFQGDAQTTHVRINGEPALVMAASPECLSVLPAKAVPGPAQISVASAATPGGRWSARTTLVALDLELQETKLTPGQKTTLTVRVQGSDQRLRVGVENQVPGVLRFLRGDVQQTGTCGGPNNMAQIEVQAIRSGDFSFDAKLMPAPDEDLARAYLQAAVPLATHDLQRDVTRLLKHLEQHPRDFEVVRRNIDGILSDTIARDFRTVLVAARTALS